MQKGEIRGPVKTRFGYHIIRLDDVRPANQRPFEEVRAELEAEYRRDQAQSLFYERSQQLADESFAALSELDTVAHKLKLPLSTVDSFTRSGGGPFGAVRKIIDAAFSNEVLVDRQNSEPVSLGEDRVVVLRVTRTTSSRQQALAEVRPAVEAEVCRDGAQGQVPLRSRAARLDGRRRGRSFERAWYCRRPGDRQRRRRDPPEVLSTSVLRRRAGGADRRQARRRLARRPGRCLGQRAPTRPPAEDAPGNSLARRVSHG
jgi:hypothetical protein